MTIDKAKPIINLIGKMKQSTLWFGHILDTGACGWCGGRFKSKPWSGARDDKGRLIGFLLCPYNLWQGPIPVGQPHLWLLRCPWGDFVACSTCYAERTVESFCKPDNRPFLCEHVRSADG